MVGGLSISLPDGHDGDVLGASVGSCRNLHLECLQWERSSSFGHYYNLGGSVGKYRNSEF